MWCYFVSSTLSVLHGDKSNPSRLASKGKLNTAMMADGEYKKLSQPNGRKMDDKVSSTKTKSSKKNTV